MTETVPGDLDPGLARDPAGLVALMRELRDRSGRSNRELAQIAAGHGAVLPHRTIASLLRRPVLPTAEVLSTFVLACGAGHDLHRWLAARDRLAATAASTGFQEPGRPGFDRRQLVLAATAVAAAVAAVVAAGWVLFSGDPAPEGRTDGSASADRTAPPAPTGGPGPTVSPTVATTATATGVPGDALFLPAEGSLARIHPARTPELCVTEGRTSGYQSAVAVQRPCTEAEPPRTRLEPVGDGYVHIVWDHPDFGPGCLTGLAEGPAADLLEPWTDCRDDRPQQLFQPEPVAGPDAAGHRLRRAESDLCLGIRDDAEEPGAVVVLETCADQADQIFRIDLFPA